MKASKNLSYEQQHEQHVEISFPPLEKKLWLLPLNEIYKGKNIIVYNTYPEASTNTALFSRICTIKVQDHQIKCISIMHGQL